MAEVIGIKETLDVIRAASDLAVMVFRVQKGGGAPAEIARKLVVALIANPNAINSLKEAADGIGQVPAEIGDLTMKEIFELVREAGKLAADAAEAIR